MNPLILIILAVAGYAVYTKSKSTTPASNSSSNNSGNALSTALGDLENGNWSDAMNAISGGQATEQTGGQGAEYNDTGLTDQQLADVTNPQIASGEDDDGSNATD